MAFLFSKTVKDSMSRRGLIKCYIAVVLCAIVIVGNIVLFMFLLKSVAWLSVLVSNAITIVLLLLASRPINTLLEKEFSRRASEMVEKQREEESMKERITELERQNRELESRLDTWSQTAGMPANVILTSKVETMAFNKSGYIVKEEPLEQFKSDPQYGIQDKKGFMGQISRFMDSITNPGSKKVLYIGKYSVNASLGLDFEKIRFATQKDTLYLYGISISKLHDLPKTESPLDVNHCWLLSGDTDEELSLSLSGTYKDFLDVYKKEQENETAQAVEAEMDGLFRMYTDTFRRSLTQRFPGLVFTDSMDASLTWLPLGEHLRDERINRIATNMFLMATAVSGYFDRGRLQLESHIGPDVL